MSDWSSAVCSSDLLHEAIVHADDWQQMPDPPLLWINTAVLIASSIAWEVARQRRQVRAALTGTALSLLFLAGQLMLWWHYRTAGYGLRSEEHTSELQSLMRISYAVFCLIKKKTHNSRHSTQYIN